MAVEGADDAVTNHSVEDQACRSSRTCVTFNNDQRVARLQAATDQGGALHYEQCRKTAEGPSPGGLGGPRPPGERRGGEAQPRSRPSHQLRLRMPLVSK